MSRTWPDKTSNQKILKNCLGISKKHAEESMISQIDKMLLKREHKPNLKKEQQF